MIYFISIYNQCLYVHFENKYLHSIILFLSVCPTTKKVWRRPLSLNKLLNKNLIKE